ncbi:NXPE family member 3-like isoform X2 [Gigantopelta aegis]|uniref:NXPE family member 3-like isoform X2 n=1 Tax=Gigantopelta aegis TaxID=1735272 RepID=UPI001B88846A|nr:NXPE family member 3-like isoform X2 [Gigantopelta aegis]
MEIPVKKNKLLIFLFVVFFYTLIREYMSYSTTVTNPPEILEEKINIKKGQLVESVHVKPQHDKTNIPKHCVDSYDLDPKKPAAASMSKIVLLGNERKLFELGEKITVRITLSDGNGKAKSVGGDQVRVWMVEPPKKANSAGYVIDHGNGTYTGHLKALWVGSPVIRSAIAITCEGIGVRHHALKVPGKLRGLVGVFKSQNISEETVCAPSLDFKGEFCNFTAENFGLPWFCARPKNLKLLCHDWVKVRGIYQFSYTGQEVAVMKGHNLLKPEINITVTSKGKKREIPPTTPCYRFPSASTWSMTSPVGYLYNGEWFPTYCVNTINNSVSSYTKCLKNRRVLMIGDSCVRQWFLLLNKMLHIETFEKFRNHRPLYSRNKLHNISMFWASHGYPFLHPSNFLNNKAFSKPAHVYLDKLPDGCNDIIIINNNLHFQVYSPEHFERQIKAFVRSATSLMARAPNVKIIVKGFHAFRDGYVWFDDYWALVYKSILDKYVAPIQDKVIYLNNWDMTMSGENADFHNSETMDKVMVHNALGHICT